VPIGVRNPEDFEQAFALMRVMDRRAFIGTLAGGLLAAPLAQSWTRV
jgi:hypothetical protein